jgi:hypothetical protein
MPSAAQKQRRRKLKQKKGHKKERERMAEAPAARRARGGSNVELEDDATAQDCGIVDGGTIALVVRAACPKCSLPTVSRGGMVFCSKAWEPVHSQTGLYDEQFYPGGSKEYGGTGCGWSETPVKGAGEATCKRCGSTETRTNGGSGGWDGFWWKRECDNPHCGYKYEASGVYR